MAYKKYTPEEAKAHKAEKMENIKGLLTTGVQEVFTSDKFANYLAFSARFHTYSFRNTLLIMIQHPTASRVAGLKEWNKMGRRVIKGEKAISILAPSIKKRKEDVKKPDGTTETEEETFVAGFFPVNVFAEDQTEGDDLPTLVSVLTNEVDGYEKVKAALEGVAAIPITYEPINDGSNGYFSPRENRIVVKEGMSESQTLKTLVHEIAHSILHCKGGEEEKAGRGTKEVQAEATAFTVLKYLGIDTDDYSFGYIAGWAGERKLAELEDSLKVIQTTASKIIEAVENAA